MRIDTAQVYKFFFSYEGTEIMIPMAAETQQEAIKKLRAHLLSWANELAVVVNSPTPSPAEFQKAEESIPDPMMLVMRIEEMVKNLIPLKKPKGAQTMDKLVKDWTGFPLEPANYASIIAELGRLNPNQQ